MSKTLSQPVVQSQSEQTGVELNRNAADEQMVQQSMRALENQELYEQENENSIDVMQPMSTETYGQYGQDGLNVDNQIMSDTVNQNEQETTGLTAGGTNASNVFANIFHKLAAVFGKDNTIGAKCEEWAKEIENSSTTDAEATQIQQDTLAETSLDGATTGVEDGIDIASQPTGAIINAESEGISNANMQTMAQGVAQDDGFVKAATASNSKFEQLDNKVTDMTYTLSENTMGSLAGVDVTGEDKSKVAGTYMTMMHGLQEFNTTAIDEINTKYADDERKKATAMEGLGKIMNRAVEPAMANTAIDNNLYGFLSESDKQELDSMSFTGVDKTFSDIEAEKVPEKSQENTMPYANALKYDKIGKSTAPMRYGMLTELENMSSGLSMSKSSLQLGTRDYQSVMDNSSSFTGNGRGNRAAQAENAFSTVLDNDKAAKQTSFTDGLER